MIDAILIIIIVGTMISFNALYVAGEFATVSARKSRVMVAANEGNRLAKLLLPIIEDTHKLDSYIAASQVGITISSVVLGIYGQQQIAPLIEPLLAKLPFIAGEAAAAGVAVILVLIFLTTLQVILGELVPKTIAIRYPERVAFMTVLPMRWSADIILRPLIVILNGSGVMLLKLLGSNHSGEHHHVHSPEEIQLLIQQSHEGGLLNAEERELLGNALLMGNLMVGDIMVPRPKMVMASIDTSVVELLRLAIASHHTRIPIYEDNIDHIKGVIHLKDLFHLYQQDPATSIRNKLHSVSFVPETMHINNVWNLLNRDKTYSAIVFDEYGGTMGMVTREDLLEALFGEVLDEFDVDEKQPIVKIGVGEYRVQGDVALTTLNHQFDLALTAEHAHTISGLIINKLQREPQINDELEFDNIHVQIEAVSEHMVDQLRLKLVNIYKEQT